MRAQFQHFKKEVISLRKLGRTYSEINAKLGVNISKSTLSTWCKDVVFSLEHKKRIKRMVEKNIHKGRSIALVSNKIKRERYLREVYSRVEHLGKIFKNKEVARIALAVLYLGEGAKTRSSLMFGNSDPEIISLFLRLLRYCYKIDESKFRCTLQCRADQDVERLEKFWSNITNISSNRFYKARIDKRTIGKISRKPEYKGVCRIDYFSADLFNELMKIIEVIGKVGM